jgi:hypothetical protein
LPDTDAISPLTCAWPLAGADEVVCGVPGAVAVELGDVVGLEVFEVLDVFDEPQAATDSAAAPVTARTANRVSRGTQGVAGINVSPIVGGARRPVYPLQLCLACVDRPVRTRFPKSA